MARQPDPIRFTVDADTRKFRTGIRRAESDLKDLERQGRDNIEIDAKVDVDDSELDLLRRRLRDTRRQLLSDLEVGVDVDVLKTTNQINTIERRLKQLDRLDVKPEINVDVDRGVRGFGRISAAVEAAAVGMRGLSGGLSALPPQAQAAAAAIGAVVAGLATPVLVGTAGGLLAGGVALGAKKFLGEVAELEAGSRKFRTVFGGMTEDVQKWSEAVSLRGGVGVREIQSLAAGVQDLLVPVGYNRADAAEITKQVTERGIALAEFSGVEKAAGIEAVTKALLGEREQLKGLGVQIRQSEVKDWLADNENAVRGMSDAQAEVTATLAILEAKSGDAWKAYNEGGSEAEQVLDALNATFANVKDALLQGFGGVFTDLLGDILALRGGIEGLEGVAGNIGAWFEENASRVRAAMLTIADSALAGAQAALNMGKYIVEGFVGAAPLIAASVRAFGDLAATLQTAAGAALILVPGMQKTGLELIRSADGTRQAADGFASLVDEAAKFGPDVVSGLDAAGEKVEGFRGEVQALRDMDRVVIDMTTKLDQGDVKGVRQDLRDLSAEELEAIIQVTENGTSETDQKINKMARRLRKAKVEVVDEGTASQTGAKIDKIARQQRKAPIQAFPDNVDPTRRTLDGLAKPRSSWITVNFRVGQKAPSIGGGFVTPMSGLPDLGAPVPALNTARYTSDLPWWTSDQTVSVGVPGGQGQVFAPQVTINNPEPERASDSIGLALRIARYQVGV